MLSPGLSRLLRWCHSSGRCRFGIPLALRVPQREDSLLGPRSLLVAAGAAERCVELPVPERVEQRPGLEQAAAALGPDRERLSAVGDRRLIGVDDQPRADVSGVPVPELDHLAELVSRVDVQQRERNWPGIERLLRQPQQHRRVLADRVEHHRPFELRDHLPDDVDALGLERAQSGPAGRAARLRNFGSVPPSSMSTCSPQVLGLRLSDGRASS